MSKQTKLYIDHTSYTMETSIPDPDDSWDRANTLTEHSVDGIRLDSNYGYGNYCYYPGEVKKGDKIYLLYAVWSTGDSFGHDVGYSIDFISVHKNIDIANSNANVLENIEEDINSSWETKWNGKLMLDNGDEYKYHIGWLGYFESLDYIRVKEFIVK